MTAASGNAVSAGEFSVWLHETREALRTGAASDVPCGTCTACCTSSYFIHIGPNETDALAHIGEDGLIPAPGMPHGHMLMGYDHEGLCPQMSRPEEGLCAVYAHRPQTCRRYDCRVFAAVGITAGDDKPRINKRVEEWVFDYSDRDAHREQDAVRAVTRFIRENASHFPGGKIPESPSQLAVLAIKVYPLFLDREHSGDSAKAAGTARAIVDAARTFDAEMPER